MLSNHTKQTLKASNGFSMPELIVVVAIIAIVSAIALPQLNSARTLFRSAGISREVMTQLRYARQQSITRRNAVTFQYNNLTKQINIFSHRAPGPDAVANTADDIVMGVAVLNTVGYPVTPGRTTLRTVSLAGSGVAAANIIYGRPAGASVIDLTDSTNLTALTNDTVNITFQPNGAVIATTELPANFALLFYNDQAPDGTATAVSVLGAAGRVKLWRYNPNGIPKTYVD